MEITLEGLQLYFKEKSLESTGLDDDDFDYLRNNKNFLKSVFKDIALPSLIEFFKFLDEAYSQDFLVPDQNLTEEQVKEFEASLLLIREKAEYLPRAGLSNQQIDERQKIIEKIPTEFSNDQNRFNSKMIIKLAIVTLGGLASTVTLWESEKFASFISDVIDFLIRFGLIF